MLDNNTIKTVEDLLKKEKTSTLLKESIKELRYEKSSRYQYFICFILAFLVAVYVTWSPNTIPVMRHAVDVILGIEVGLIAVVISSYSIFQALLSDGFIMALAKTENNLLKISNKSFLNLTICYLIAIGMNIIIGIVLEGMADNWFLCANAIVNYILSSIICGIYFGANFLSISEICNFALNLYRMFNAANCERIIKIIENEEKERD
nr:MAG TPA: hypothetical protein [Caudoviricetes sp.]